MGFRHRIVAVVCFLLFSALAHSQKHDPFLRFYPAAGDLKFELHDDINNPIYSWPRTLLTYSIDFSERPCTAAELQLLDASGTAIPFQWSSIKTRTDGRLLSAKLNFFAELTPGATKTFRLEIRSNIQASPNAPSSVIEHRSGGVIEVDTETLGVRLPDTQPIEAGAEIPAPILALHYGDASSSWIGRNKLTIGVGNSVTHITTSETETGNLFRTYEVAYSFSNGGSYVARLRIVAGYPFVLFSEQMENITPEMKVAVEMDWQDLAPKYRFAANGWMQPRNELGIDEAVTTPGIIEEPHWFPADRVEDPKKEMIFHLAAFEGNAPREAVPAMSFWEAGVQGRELGVFVPDATTWDDRQYMIWQPSTLLQVSFRYANGELIWHWPVVSGTRETGIALAATETGEQTMKRMRDTYTAGGKGYPHAFEDNGAYSSQSLHSRYTEWLRAWYGSLDLNHVKDWVLTYPASAHQAPPPLIPEAPSNASLPAQANQLENKVLHSMLMDYPLGSDLGVMNISHRTIRPIIEQYMQVRSVFTPQQKARIDALLLLSAYINTSDDLAPSRICLSGTPNMSADGFSVPDEVGILFPDHPMVSEWHDQFQKIVALDGAFYTRPAVPAYQSLGGRWTESLATYNWAYFVPVLTAQVAISHTDGSNRIAGDALAQRARWMVDELSAPIYNPNPYWRQHGSQPPAANPWKPGIALTPANGFERQFPSHGAHASGTGVVVPYDVPIVAKYLHNYDPIAAEHLLWAYAQRTSTEQPEFNEMYWRASVLEEMKGNTGTNPHLRSAKYTGHGIVLRNGVDTPEEVSLHLDQTDQGPNYRWGNNGEGSSGVLYFFANGQPWTGHERENTGDHSNDDATGTTTFAVLHDHAWHSIGENVLDRPLYDLGFLQFGAIDARRDHVPYSWPAYRSRSVMLVGTDYTILGDDAEGETRFSWFTMHDLAYPKIAFLQPLTTRADDWTEISTATSKGFMRDALGPSIVLFTQKSDDVELEHMTTTRISALHDAGIMQYEWKKNEAPAASGVFFVKTPSSHDRIFRSFSEVRYTGQDEAFTGKAGVIRTMGDGSTQLALVQGTHIAAKSVAFDLPRTAAESVAISAIINTDGILSGYFCNTTNDPVTLTLSAPPSAASVFYVDGAPIAATRENSMLRIDLPPGRHAWEFTKNLPTPLAPTIEKTINRADGAQIYFSSVSGAEHYQLEVSTDGGIRWQPAAEGTQSPLPLTGMGGSKKIHVRVFASNHQQSSTPSVEYPVYLTSSVPAPPDGLELNLGNNLVSAHWGQVLGVEGYRLYRRKVGQSAWTRVYNGSAQNYQDASALGVIPAAARPGIAANVAASAPSAIYEYAIASFNGNGESAKSLPVTTDPTNWRNWWPVGQDHTFKRQTGFWLPPYVPAAMSPPLHYPSN